MNLQVYLSTCTVKDNLTMKFLTESMLFRHSKGDKLVLLFQMAIAELFRILNFSEWPQQQIWRT